MRGRKPLDPWWGHFGASLTLTLCLIGTIFALSGPTYFKPAILCVIGATMTAILSQRE